MSWYGFASYSLAGLTYGVAAIILLVSHPGGRPASWLIGAAAGTSVWGFALALALMTGAPGALLVTFLDSAHSLIWILAIAAFLVSGHADAENRVRRWLAALAVATAVGATAATVLLGEAAASIAFLALVVMSVIGFLAVEQVFRNAKEEQRGAFRLLCLAVGGVFAMNLFVYSHAVMFSGMLPLLWESRGFALAILAPLIMLAVKRQPEWESELFVSRQIVFYTASLMGIGGYLVVMGLFAYLIRAAGGQWGVALQLAFLTGALVMLLAVLFSSTIRSRFKVFLVKHFYRNKYDYRHEWLRLTEILGRAGDTRALARNALEGIARIVGASQASMWLTRDGERFEWVASLTPADGPGPTYTHADPMVAFLESQRWVIDGEEYELEPERYGSAFGAPEDGLLRPGLLVVPLDLRGHLQGFAILEKSPGVGRLNFEDHDLLKTAGKQVATFIAQAIGREELAETRQFEAMNKLTAYLMHDLKNLIAQQELVVKNAQRFGHRPEFVNDAIATVHAGVERMKKVLSQLRGAAGGQGSTSRADLWKVLLEVHSRCADRAPVPEVVSEALPAWIDMDRDALASVLTHVLRNAQDATPDDGQISVSLERADGWLTVSVTDTGHGMDAEFIRERLFRPFDSTKGTQGMGIGVYQVRDLVRGAGGDVHVESAPGVGTTFRLTFPCAADQGARERPPGAPQAPETAAAGGAPTTGAGMT